jgi:hypothetical protein
MDGAIQVADLLSRNPDFIQVAGWAGPYSTWRSRWVLVAIDGRVVGRAPVYLSRPRIAAALERRELLWSGWRLRWYGFRLAPGRHRVEASALLDGARTVVTGD